MTLKDTIKSLCKRYGVTYDEMLGIWTDYHGAASRWHTPRVEEFNDMYIAYQTYRDNTLKSEYRRPILAFQDFVHLTFVYDNTTACCCEGNVGKMNRRSLWQ